MRLKTMDRIKKWHGLRVVVRVDFNVPMDGNHIRDDWRLTRTIPTLSRLLKAGAQVALISHRGRPDGRRVASASLQPLAPHLSKLLGKRIGFVRDCVGREAERAVTTLRPGEAVLLENLRFHAGEEDNSATFAKQLAAHGDLFVNDAFATAHRAHASTVGITKYLPSVAGILLAEEIKNLETVSRKPKHPFVVLMGGAKIDTKIGVMDALLTHADRMCVGGALAIPLLKAAGHTVGASTVSPSELRIARTLIRKKEVLLPVDVVVATSSKAAARVRLVDEIAKSERIYDIGPDTIRLYAAELRKAKTIVWNGPMGLMERSAFAHGTRALARHIATRSSGPAYGLVGGGETVEALHATRMADYVDWVSTGGGAMLEFLERGTLPALKPLTI